MSHGRDTRRLSFAPNVHEVVGDDGTVEPFGWVTSGEAPLERHSSIGSDMSRRRKQSRSGSLALQRWWNSESIGQPQALKGVTAFHDVEEIGSALRKCADNTRERLKSIDAGVLFPEPEDAEDIGEDEEIYSQLPESDLELVRTELQDREEQLLQAVQLGTGLLDQLNDVRAEAALNEEVLQQKIDEMSEEMQMQNSYITKYKTSLMYLLNVEEELVNKSVENDTLQTELQSLSVRASDASNIAWQEKKMFDDEKKLALREKLNEEQSAEVTMKLRELNNWKAKAARTERYEREMLAAQKETHIMEKEVHRLKKLVADRDNTVYGLRTQLSSQREEWNKASCESTIARLKKDAVVMRNKITAQQEMLRNTENEVQHYRALAERLNSKTKQVASGTAKQTLQSLHNSQCIKLATERILSEIAAMKDDLYSEFNLWLKAVADMSRDNRAQGDVLRRLRAENRVLKDKVMQQEVLDSDIGKQTARAKLVYGSQLLTKEVTSLRDVSRSIRSQASVRQVTEKEVQELACSVASLSKHFVAFLGTLLGPSEKKQIGITMDSSQEAMSPHLNSSRVIVKPKRRATAATGLRSVPPAYSKGRLKMF